MKNISREDYIIWNYVKKQPTDRLDIVYHYTSLVELVNDGYELGLDEEYVCVAELPLKWQRKISEAIEKTKSNMKTIIDIKKYYPNADYSPYLKQGIETERSVDNTLEVGMTMVNIKTGKVGLILGCIDEFYDGVVRLDSEGIVDIDDLRHATFDEILENIEYLILTK